MEDHHKRPPAEKIFQFEKQEVAIDDFECEGFVLDIGGGGEGVIGALKGKQVVAIDSNRRELEEAANGPLKVIMDARELQFLDGTFEVVTAFFGLMYIGQADHERVFQEVFRVLKPGGRFLVWDVMIPERIDATKEYYMVPIMVKLPDREIDTGYGQRLPEKAQDVPYYCDLAVRAGFRVVGERERGEIFFLQLW
jgi:ubiquinone/menaquinone biosynthesis C-methylase UbiE